MQRCESRCSAANRCTVELVEEARAAAPDVVLLDYYLGGTVGRDLIRPLIDATGATILLLTASDDPEVLGDSLEAGAAGTLLKARRASWRPPEA